MTKLTIYYQNVRGLRTKTQDLFRNVSLNNYDIIVFVETWLTDSICSNELFDGRYLVWRRDRDYVRTEQTKGGGVLIAVRKDLTVMEKCDWRSSAEDLWITIALKRSRPSITYNVHICAVYLCRENSDILPVYPDSHQFVMEQRTEQYHDLLYAVKMLELVDTNAPRCQVLLEMWLLENEERKPPLFPETNFSSADTFLPIARTLLELYTDEVDVYWLSKSLTDVVKNMQKDLPKLKEAFVTMLEKEDQELFNHLVDINALELLPLTKWFNCCFAGVLDDTSLAKIWDKVCSGAPKILAFAAVMLIITLRRNVLRAKNTEDVLKCVAQIPEQCEEVVANKAIELWQYYGAQPQNDTLAKK